MSSAQSLLRLGAYQEPVLRDMAPEAGGFGSPTDGADRAAPIVGHSGSRLMMVAVESSSYSVSSNAAVGLIQPMSRQIEPEPVRDRLE
jgi:hypothetical protein